VHRHPAAEPPTARPATPPAPPVPAPGGAFAGAGGASFAAAAGDLRAPAAGLLLAFVFAFALLASWLAALRAPATGPAPRRVAPGRSPPLLAA
jgi:hypothetical protein